MEFLLHIDVAIPAEQREQVLAAERERGEELRTAGMLRRIWRVPGTTANYSLWDAPDPTVLHAALQSLPAFPWATIAVTALAEHPLEAPDA